MPTDPNFDRLKVLLEKAIKKGAEGNAARTAFWVSLLEPLADTHLPADWRTTHGYP